MRTVPSRRLGPAGRRPALGLVQDKILDNPLKLSPDLQGGFSSQCLQIRSRKSGECQCESCLPFILAEYKMSFELRVRGGREMLWWLRGKIRVKPLFHLFSTVLFLRIANPITTFNTEPPMGKSRMNNLRNKNSGIDRLWGFLRLGLQSSLDPNKSFLIRDKLQHPSRQKRTKIIKIAITNSGSEVIFGHSIFFFWFWNFSGTYSHVILLMQQLSYCQLYLHIQASLIRLLKMMYNTKLKVKIWVWGVRKKIAQHNCRVQTQRLWSKKIGNNSSTQYFYLDVCSF